MRDWILSCNRCQAEGSQRIVLTTSLFLRIYHYCKMDFVDFRGCSVVGFVSASYGLCILEPGDYIETYVIIMVF